MNLEGTEELVLELSKATRINTPKNMIHFDQLENGTWRLMFSGDLIEDFSKIKSFEVIREN